MAAGTNTCVEETSGSLKKIKWSFTAGTGGDVDSIGSAQTSNAFSGLVQGLITVGGASMSASWSVTVKDQSSIDILMGQGASRNAATEYTARASLAGVANDKLTLGITGTGVSHPGEVYLLIR